MKKISSSPFQVIEVQKGFFFFCDQDYVPQVGFICETDRLFPYKSIDIVTKDTLHMLKRGAIGILNIFDTGLETAVITGMGDINFPALVMTKKLSTVI